MQKQRATKTIVMVCLLAGVLAGAAGAQVVEAVFRLQFLNTSLFTVTADQEAAFHVTLHDRRGALPVRVALRLFDAAGNPVGGHDAVLQAGASTTLRVPGPGDFRAHARIVDSTPVDLTLQRQISGSVEVIDRLTGVIRPTCSFDPWGLPPGR